MVKNRDVSGNSANARDNQGKYLGKCFVSSINRYPSMLKNLARKHILSIVKLLSFSMMEKSTLYSNGQKFVYIVLHCD